MGLIVAVGMAEDWIEEVTLDIVVGILIFITLSLIHNAFQIMLDGVFHRIGRHAQVGLAIERRHPEYEGTTYKSTLCLTIDLFADGHLRFHIQCFLWRRIHLRLLLTGIREGTIIEEISNFIGHLGGFALYGVVDSAVLQEVPRETALPKGCRIIARPTAG